MRPPAPMTPMRRVSFAPSTLVEARAVSPLAIRKLRRLGLSDMALCPFVPAIIVDGLPLRLREARIYLDLRAFALLPMIGSRFIDVCNVPPAKLTNPAKRQAAVQVLEL